MSPIPGRLNRRGRALRRRCPELLRCTIGESRCRKGRPRCACRGSCPKIYTPKGDRGCRKRIREVVALRGRSSSRTTAMELSCVFCGARQRRRRQPQCRLLYCDALGGPRANPFVFNERQAHQELARLRPVRRTSTVPGQSDSTPWSGNMNRTRRPTGPPDGAGLRDRPRTSLVQHPHRDRRSARRWSAADPPGPPHLPDVRGH